MEILPVQVKANADIKADVTPAIQAASNVVSSSNKGIGKLFRAAFGPWIANRERAIALANAQTERDRRLIAEGKLSFRDGNLLSIPESNSNILFALHELNHQGDARRFQEAMQEAVSQLSGVPDEQISDEPLSQTFFNRWRREAELIDEEGLRQFWSSLLVKETKQPGSITPRTLDVARNLSQEDARLFEHMAKFTCDNALFVNNDGAPPNRQYPDLLQLINAGVLGSQSSRRMFPTRTDATEHKPCADIVFATDGFLIKCFGDKVLINCHILTNEGFALLKILNVRRSQDDIVAIAKTIAAPSPHRLVSVHKIVHIDKMEDGSYNYKYERDPLWTTKKPSHSDKD